MKGILLAGGSGTRLQPLTLAMSKQLLPVYDKPMIYYPLATLMLAGVHDILIISTPESLPDIQRLFGDGSHLGLSIGYRAQPEPRGIAEAYLLGAAHVAGQPSALILGDNFFHGSGFRKLLLRGWESLDGCTLFSYPVTDPERYAVGELDAHGNLVSIEEKPVRPLSSNAITGLYFYGSDVVDIARELHPSARGELEITDINRIYLKDGRAKVMELGRGFTWIDAGTQLSLLEASEYVRIMESRQGVRVACIEEIALRMGLIDADSCYRLGAEMPNSEYGRYVMSIAGSIA
ncbi:glucose-1-phosphate thymidylyltransferase RfbA [Nonomuraea sp. NPDC003709]|uniref:glucose-1-phosphate thymidylyltransferase RfbA n=1 Tax=Nonomuraea sp. NPDC003709 TaxID=3154450 RepID=UPI0033B1139E